jgi:hemoglobin
MNEPFEEFGEEGFAALVAAFYRRVKDDDLVGHFYRMGDLKEGEVRLRDFLIQRFGGGDRYHERAKFEGHIGIAHSWMAITPAVRERWLEMMSEAMDEVGLEGKPRQRLEEHFNDVSLALVSRPDWEPHESLPSEEQRLAAKKFNGSPDDEL